MSRPMTAWAATTAVNPCSGRSSHSRIGYPPGWCAAGVSVSAARTYTAESPVHSIEGYPAAATIRRVAAATSTPAKSACRHAHRPQALSRRSIAPLPGRSRAGR
ncbi:hypothetical protein ACFQGX_31045 [Nonomuraea dietziae]|uniref:hypothetical protein n=1 Tax=Nonomuraea dietziae TaxID=65515 RepID=UPI00361176D1